jgi:hypothetical protein
MKCSDELSWICIDNFKMSNFHEVMSEQQNHEQQDAPQDERNPESPKSASRNHRGWRPSS